MSTRRMKKITFTIEFEEEVNPATGRELTTIVDEVLDSFRESIGPITLETVYDSEKPKRTS